MENNKILICHKCEKILYCGNFEYCIMLIKGKPFVTTLCTKCIYNYYYYNKIDICGDYKTKRICECFTNEYYRMLDLQIEYINVSNLLNEQYNKHE